MFHIVSMDVVSLQQTAVAGALHGELQNTDTEKLMKIRSNFGLA